MPIIGAILQDVVKWSKVIHDRRQLKFNIQEETLKKLLSSAKDTKFGKSYNFRSILKSDNFIKKFQESVPVFDYDSIYDSWWHRLIAGESDICWPGKIKYFGLTSGTAGATSKKVPVSHDMIKSMRKAGIRQLLALSEFELPYNFYQKGVLMLGGSTSLIKISDYFEGDLSGILAGRLPFWFNRFYKPGEKISKERNWELKLDMIIKHAKEWDIGGIAGVPAWVQILMERIIKHYNVSTIHDIWPNFRVYAHGGVSFEPYKTSFGKLLGKEVYFLETYLASEGFLAYQNKKDRNMQLVLDNGIFFEFVPFNKNNFKDGNIVENPETLLLNEVSANVDYAILLSTNAGAWRYIIGDTIRFTSLENYEIIITGRTKHFLSLCGEHLSVDNMSKAVTMLSEQFNINIKEFTVAGIPYENLFAHKWYLGIEGEGFDKDNLARQLDENLKQINDDYRTERISALKEVLVEILPVSVFYNYMKMIGKEGGQNKFPRVINSQLANWESFVKNYNK